MLKRIDDLQLKVSAKNFKVDKDVNLWGGADVVITDAMTKDLELWQGNPPFVVGIGKLGFAGRQVVCTKLARELSYVFYELKDIFQEYIDYNNKYEFYGRLASAARIADCYKDEKNMLIETINEAKRMAEEIINIAYYYFAYGSNMNSVQMSERCPGAKIEARVRLQGFRFIINERGVGSIIEDSLSHTDGILWSITKEHIDILDEREGVKHNTYFRKNITVMSLEQVERQYEALVYIASNNKLGKPRLGYLERVIEGAQENGIDSDYIRILKQNWE
ncbi:AIG2 family protein [Desulfitobacterium sp. LBE]|uniref:gamma-glutamylcyclotransferase family protein n=1 Tax=Desulfitobacterium sp. LBE TaxID=884086 RepID=UPI00119C15B6|nr:gamma-glutamylcyclotransferase family protein [Desulfitobacterium sp. LBE]TWH59374.1 AIG2 family protein [Desulfitobacterium sp. LBE]